MLIKNKHGNKKRERERKKKEKKKLMSDTLLSFTY